MNFSILSLNVFYIFYGISSVMIVLFQNCNVSGNVIAPLQQPSLSSVDEGNLDTVVMLMLQKELIQNLTKRMDDLERTIKDAGLDQKYKVVQSPRRHRRRRTVGERGDTNANVSNTEQGQNPDQNGQVNLSPYWMGQCMLCPNGPPGPPGPIGPQGLAGRDGRDGRDATSVYSIATGTQNDGTPHPTADPVPGSDWHQYHVNSSSGVIYTRWGRTECPPSAELVYEGIAGGAHYTHTGSGSNYLCLPLEPIYDRPWPGNQGEAGAVIYGAEYQTGAFAPFNGLHDHEVPCAVCRAPSRSSLLMLPARNECPDSSWITEYTGWLVAAHHGHKKSEFNCMDKEPVAVPRTATNQDGALFYLVEGRCASNGGLPCGPYVEGYELTCAVCTR